MAKHKRPAALDAQRRSKKPKEAATEDEPQLECPEGNPASEEEEDAQLTPEERRARDRKLKKERRKQEKRLRQAGGRTPVPRPSSAQLALDYLLCWAQKREEWRFQKTRQTWLLAHMFQGDEVPDEHFSTLLAYLEGLRGLARQLTVQKAEALMRELDAAGKQDAEPPAPRTQERARQVLQLLS